MYRGRYGTDRIVAAGGSVIVDSDGDVRISGGPFIDAGHPDYGADPSASGATNTTAIQDALDAANTAGGGTVLIAEPGTYDLDEAGTNPYDSGNRYCLDIGDGVSGITLALGPGVTLRLADDQQTDANGEVDMIVFRDSSGISVIGAGRGASRITGNTAGQTNWTGGYKQTTHAIVQGYVTASNGLDDCQVQGLTLDDHFGNTVVLGGSAATSQRCAVRECYGFDCGEGFVLIEVDDCTIIDVGYEDISDVAVGDAVEVSGCTNFSISHIHVAQNGAGAGIDLFGSQKGTVSNFVVDGWDQGIQAADKSGQKVDEVSVGPGLVRNCSNSSAIINPGNGRNSFVNVQVLDNSGIGFLAAGSASDPPVELVNVVCKGNTNGNIRLQSGRDLKMVGGAAREAGASADGIRVIDSGSVLRLYGADISNNGRHGIAPGGNLDSSSQFIGCDFTGNGDDFINAVDQSNPIVRNCLPDEKSIANPEGDDQIGMYRVMFVSGPGTYDTLVDGTENQLLLFVLTGNVTLLDKDNGSAGVNANVVLSQSGSSFAGASGDEILLRFNPGDGFWHETSRTLASSALTSEDSSTVDATYGSEEQGVIQNLRTRVGELEQILKDYGQLPP